MAPIDADVAEVEAQLSAIRLRRNGLVVQRALAGAFSVAIVAAAAMVAAALRGGGLLFTIASALAVLATVAGAAHAAWRTRRDWLSLPATAHLADVHAALDERLTTLLAVASATPPPALRPLLVEQLVGARQRWSIEALAPQRLSRWLALIPLALLVFAATAFYARPPAVAAGRRATSKPLSLAAQRLVGPAEVEQSAREQGLFTGGGSGLAMATGARGGDRRGAGIAAGRTDAAAGADLAAGADGMDTPGTADGGTASDRPAEGGLDGLRRSIREAFGAPAESAASGGERGVGREAGGRGGDQRAPSAGDDRRTDGAQPAGARAGRPERADTATDVAPAATPGADSDAADQGSRGSARGGAGGAAAGGVLGATGAPRLDTNTTAPVTITLNAITGVSPSETEPQRHGQGVPAMASRPRPNAPLPDLANEQLADVTMQQLEIGPEHEAIIRRLFTRE